MANDDIQKPLVILLDGIFDGETSPPMQKEFRKEIASPTQSSDPLEALLRLNNYNDRVTIDTDKVVEVAATPEDAYTIIKNHQKARIFFVSSGSLGKTAIPHIAANFSNITSFYIFCAIKANHVPWARQYASHLQMFIHPTDLLVQLMRDISEYFMKYGEPHYKLDNADYALRYFRHAKYLEDEANRLDEMRPNTKTGEKLFPKPARREFLDLLEGDNGFICLAEKKQRNASGRLPQSYDRMDTT